MHIGNSVFQAALTRTKSRWKGYVKIFFTYILGPFILALILSVVSAIILPQIVGLYRHSGDNAAAEVIAGLLAIAVPAAAIVAATYRSLIGTLGLYKVLIDTEYKPAESIKQSKSLVFPYLQFTITISLLNVGFLPFMPVTLLILGMYLNVWTQFAMFSFFQDSQKGGYNVWKAVNTLSSNFISITGKVIVLQLIGLIISSIGTIVRYFLKSGGMSITLSVSVLLQIISIVAFFIYQIFATAYMYELYKSVKKSDQVRLPRLWIATSILGWLVIIGLFGLGINYLITTPIRFPANGIG